MQEKESTSPRRSTSPAFSNRPRARYISETRRYRPALQLGASGLVLCILYGEKDRTPKKKRRTVISGGEPFYVSICMAAEGTL